jgi:NAD(P)-dependent dehydrogenase (short-subunit alcohol dehydrogenase family)
LAARDHAMIRREKRDEPEGWKLFLSNFATFPVLVVNHSRRVGSRAPKPPHQSLPETKTVPPGEPDRGKIQFKRIGPALDADFRSTRRGTFMAKTGSKKKVRPAQEQEKQPGEEWKMTPKPQAEPPLYQSSGKLRGKVAFISGGDSGIGRAVAMLFAKEGADVAISYLDEDRDANETRTEVEQEGRRCLLLAGDIGQEAVCQRLIAETVDELGRLDILVNNAAEQHPQDDILNISEQQLERTFRTNIFSFFFLTKAALKHLPAGGAIINSTSVTAYRGSSHLLDYAATKGAIVAFTRSLSSALAEKKIRVNAVAPGPIWTPLIPSTFPAEHVEKFGSDVPMKRPGEPKEVAPCYLFLASEDSSYMTGQVLHPNGGEIING